MIAFAQGLVNGPASWVNEKVFDENPHYAGAAVVGKELSKNLVMEAATAGIGKLLDLARPAEAVSETALSEVEAISVRNSKPGGTGSVGAAALDDPVFGSENLSYGDTKATLKAIRRHSERLVSGDVISNDSVVRDLTANVQGTFAAGDRTRAGSALHELNFEGSRLAERLIKSDELP